MSAVLAELGNTAASRLRQVERQVHAAAMLQQDISKIVGRQSIVRLAGEHLLISGLRQLPVSGRFIQAAQGHLERHVIGSKLDGVLKRGDGLITGARLLCSSASKMTAFTFCLSS